MYPSTRAALGTLARGPGPVRDALVSAGLDDRDIEILAGWATWEPGPEVRLPRSAAAGLLGQAAQAVTITTDDVLALFGGLVTVDQLDSPAELDRAGRFLDQLRVIATDALDRAGLIADATQPFGYLVTQDRDGRRRTHLVANPDPDDTSIVRDPDTADAIADGRRAGPVVEGHGPRRQVPHPKLRNELLPRWHAGEFPGLPDFDRYLAARLGCSRPHARKVRAAWGLKGSRGGRPTTPP